MKECWMTKCDTMTKERLYSLDMMKKKNLKKKQKVA